MSNKPGGNAPRTFAYGRVSTHRQADRGSSHAAQNSQFIRHAEYEGLDLGAPVERDFGDQGRIESRERIYFESTSAFKKSFLNRPIAREMYDQLRPGDTVLFTRVDRGFRNLADCVNTLGQLNRAQVGYVILAAGPWRIQSGDGITELLIHILAAFAQFESSLRGDRMRESIAARIANGKAYCGKPPRMFLKREGRLVPGPERDRAGLFWTWHKQRRWSFERIAREANRLRMRPPHSRAYTDWKAASLVRQWDELREIAKEMGLMASEDAVAMEWLKRHRRTGGRR